METVISFPGLGIPEFVVNAEIFSIGKFSVRWYGLLICLGMIFAFFYTVYRLKDKGIKADQITDITLFTIIFAIIGARLYYVLTSLDKYHSFWDVFKIWEGGLGIYGGVIAGVLTVFVCARIKKINPFILFDAGAPGLMMAQAIGRWGNFMNGEAYGAELTGGPLYFLRMGINPHNDILTVPANEMAYVHPTFLYESLWNILGFTLINIFYKKKKFEGEIILAYAAWYGFGRFFIELLRTDSLFIPGTNLKISCVVGLICFVAGTALLIIFHLRASRKQAEGAPYQPVYAGAAPVSSEENAPEQAGSGTAEDTESETDPAAEDLPGAPPAEDAGPEKAEPEPEQAEQEPEPEPGKDGEHGTDH